MGCRLNPNGRSHQGALKSWVLTDIGKNRDCHQFCCNDLLLDMGKKIIEFETPRLKLMLEELNLSLDGLVHRVNKKSFTQERIQNIFDSGRAEEKELGWIAEAIKVDVYDFFMPPDETDEVLANLEFR